MTTDQKRRTEDNDRTTQEIETLIMQEGDPKQRAFLIVLNNINKSLLANTHTVRDVSEKLEAHLENFASHAANEEALMNKGKGAWVVVAWVLGIVQLIGLGIWQSARMDLSTISQTITQNQAKIGEIMLRIDYIERKAGK